MGGDKQNFYRKTELLFRKGLNRLGLQCSDHQIRQLCLYCRELQKWNKKVNLVAKNTSLDDLVDKHFLDSLTVALLLADYNLISGPLLDVGSGAGFPGIPLKIAIPSLETLLLEPRQRRVTFLRHIIRLLALGKIDVLMHRTDAAEAVPRQDLQVITGRAVADVAEFLDMVEHLASPGTMIICMQGVEGGAGWTKSTESGAFRCLGIEQAMLPLSGTPRCLLLFQKKA